jgi:hypothetical protein
MRGHRLKGEDAASGSYEPDAARREPAGRRV